MNRKENDIKLYVPKKLLNVKPDQNEEKDIISYLLQTIATMEYLKQMHLNENFFKFSLEFLKLEENIKKILLFSKLGNPSVFIMFTTSILLYLKEISEKNIFKKEINDIFEKINKDKIDIRTLRNSLAHSDFKFIKSNQTSYIVFDGKIKIETTKIESILNDVILEIKIRIINPNLHLFKK